MYFTTNVSDHCYDQSVRGQGSMCSKSVLLLITRIPVSFLMEGVHIEHNDRLWCADRTKVSDYQSEVKDQCQII